MKKIYLFLWFSLLTGIAFAAPPTRQFSYEAGSTILSEEVTSNEDAIFNYLQGGVDSFAPFSIDNADISASANIQSDKLNLQSIAQNVLITASGSFDNNGPTTLDNTVGITGALTVTANSTLILTVEP